MTPAHSARLRELPPFATDKHPFGARYAVLERAAILIFDAGMQPDAADELAYRLEVGGQMQLGGVL